jgi:hypothetical protein
MCRQYMCFVSIRMMRRQASSHGTSCVAVCGGTAARILAVRIFGVAVFSRDILHIKIFYGKRSSGRWSFLPSLLLENIWDFYGVLLN